MDADHVAAWSKGGATSSAFLRDLSTILNWLGSVLLLYSIYKLSHIAATIQAKERLSSVD